MCQCVYVAFSWFCMCKHALDLLLYTYSVNAIGTCEKVYYIKPEN